LVICIRKLLGVIRVRCFFIIYLNPMEKSTRTNKAGVFHFIAKGGKISLGKGHVNSSPRRKR
jgi:hypothetical protein